MSLVLVTGATGCIGSNLAARLLADGHEVRILRRSGSDLRAIGDLHVEHRLGDVREPGAVLDAAHGCELVFHAAAIVTHATRHRDEQYQVNVIGTRNVVTACRKARVRRLIHVSSVAAIGLARDGEPATEETPFTWRGRPGYKSSKHLAEAEITAGVEEGLDAVIVNPAVVVGERDIHFHGGQLLRDSRRGLIPVYVDGGMNVVYVGDVVDGMIRAAERGRTGERYILGGENLTHREIFTRTAALVGGHAPVARLPIPLLRAGAAAIERFCNLLRIEPWVSSDLVANAGRFNWYSSAKAGRELGYTITPFDVAILRALEWYRGNGFFRTP